MTDAADPLLADLEVELALRGFAGRVDDDGHHVWRRKAAPAMRVRVRRDGRRADRLRGDLRCDGIGVLRFGRRSGKETLGVDAVLSTIDAWLARQRRAEATASPTPGGLADEDRWISAVELSPPTVAPVAAPTPPEEPGALEVGTVAPLPAVLDDLTGELRATLAENRSLHRELADARERAARAETESSFLTQRLQEVRETAAALGELRRRLEDTRAGEAEARARADVAEAELTRLRRELDSARSAATPPGGPAPADPAPTRQHPPEERRPSSSGSTRRGNGSTTIATLRRFFGPGRRNV
jgi:hypothetical protein